MDLEPVLAFARTLLAVEPLSGSRLRRALGERFPDLDPGAAAYACRNFLALVHVPPRGLWGRTGPIATTTAEAWLGRPLIEHPSLDAVVLRYLAAFGPATVADVTAWCRLTGLREVLERLGPQLRPFRDERGRELFDLPDAPRPHPDTAAGPAPVRGSVLHDGWAVATWHLTSDDGDVTLMVVPAVRLTRGAITAIEAEGIRALRIIAPDASAHDVRTAPPPG